MSKYLIVDGSALLHRAYHALPLFTSKEGVPTNALHGFSKMLLSLLEKVQPTFLSVAFDTPIPTFRKQLVPSYQAQRPKASADFIQQIPLVKEFLQLAGFNYFLKEGFEADDVIGTMAKRAAKNKQKPLIYIFTGDKDILQLVNKNTWVLMPKMGVSSLYYMNQEAVKEKLGILPSQIVDYKALVGDPSDNYQGVKGVGPKTAVKLLLKYQTLDNLYHHLNELENNLKQKLLDHKEQAVLAKKLAQLVNNVELEFDLDKNVLKPISVTKELLGFCERYGLKSLKKQLVQIKSKTELNNSVDKQGLNQLSFF